MKIVLDSNVVMAGFLWPGICTQFFDLANAGRIEPLTSRDLVDEIREVLHRPKHAHHVARTGFTVEQLIDQYQRFAKRIPARKFTKQICRDTDDDAVLACALAAKADVIVTGDKDLIVLHSWHGIQILNPADALQWLTSST